jgi:nitrogen fixation-related uncharacterized protein
MSWYWYVLIIIILLIALAWCLSNHCFDDDDADMHWNDNYAAPKQRLSQKYCQHPYEARYTKLIESIVTCETTVTACALCGKHLTEPETDC